MARFLWLVGTIIVGAAIAVGSWFWVRGLTRHVHAAAHAEGDVVAQNQPTNRTQPAARTSPPAANGNFNDNEAPPDSSNPEQPKTFIGALRDALDGATDLDMDKDEYLKTLDDAEIEFQKIKQQNRAALARVNRRPPISIPQSPNYILIDMPGLGYSDLAVFSEGARPDQALDAFAALGTVFTHYYAASASPSANSCSILTGLHSGRTRIRGSEPVVPLALNDVTIAEILWRAGYATAMVGEWRLGGGNTSGAPMRQGFEESWYSFDLDNDASPNVWRDDRRVADDLQPSDWPAFRAESIDQVLSFITRHRSQPIFIYLSLPIDGADREDALSQTDEHLNRLDKAVREMNLTRETYFVVAGFPGKNLPALKSPSEETIEKERIPEAPAEEAEVPAEKPAVEERSPQNPPAIIPGAKAPKALPRRTNKVLETDFSELKKNSNGAAEDTPAEVDTPESTDVERSTDSETLQTQAAREVAGLRGSLGEMYEGGLRAPLIIWSTKRPPGGLKHNVVAAWDILPTLATMSYAQVVPNYLNGGSFGVLLQVHGETAALPFHTALYWESHGDGFSRAFLYGKWKLIQVGEDGPVELYNLDVDPQETRNIADQQPELVEKLLPLLDLVRNKSRHWPRPGEPAPEANQVE